MNNTLLYVITVLIWGTTWIAINYQLGDVPAEASIVYRFGLAALLLFAYCRVKKLSLAFNRKQHLQFLFFGLMLFGCNYYFLYSAQQHINSALASIAFSMIMFFNVVNARIWFKTKITQQTYLGALLGLTGIVVLFWPQINDTELGAETLLGLSLCFVGTLFASTGNMVSMKNKLMNLPMMQANAWGMFYGSIFMTVLLLAQGKSFSFSYTLPYISSLIYLSVFGSIIAFASYLTLLNNIGAHKASYASVMFPAVAVVISTIFEGFSWNIYTVIGLLIIVAGNIAVLTKPRKKNVIMTP
ncbi:DMT family transporter [Colwellia hornerae]|uniref:EamA family transporter n=1 Tax=Colwellia hornerae TaxID=89402 RepID=A0A5C6QCG8_9GAMM|nr:EamA family transporter [Colwellia hornerae]TWX55192.1 EamA family transporter [Colwellia hornerae]TWX61192.1 EamA family transporter [Colwellia hornerae]TWX66458.1 EamA family transporter [Colwellia hornerae]